MSNPSSARTPREVADAIELWNCPPLRARISEAQCERNHAKARSTKGVNPLEACLTCPGVRALAKGSGPVERVARDAPIANEAADARGRRRGQNKRIAPFVGRPMKPPSAKSVVNDNFDRVRRLLEKQRRFTLALVDAVEPVTRKFGARKGPKRKSPETGSRPSKAPAKVEPENRSERQDVS